MVQGQRPGAKKDQQEPRRAQQQWKFIAALANKAGKFTQPTSGAINAALASFGTIPASGSESLINTSDPKGYPIINLLSDHNYHGKALSPEDAKKALAEIG